MWCTVRYALVRHVYGSGRGLRLEDVVLNRALTARQVRRSRAGMVRGVLPRRCRRFAGLGGAGYLTSVVAVLMATAGCSTGSPEAFVGSIVTDLYYARDDPAVRSVDWFESCLRAAWHPDAPFPEAEVQACWSKVRYTRLDHREQVREDGGRTTVSYVVAEVKEGWDERLLRLRFETRPYGPHSIWGPSHRLVGFAVEPIGFVDQRAEFQKWEQGQRRSRLWLAGGIVANVAVLGAAVFLRHRQFVARRNESPPRWLILLLRVVALGCAGAVFYAWPTVAHLKWGGPDSFGQWAGILLALGPAVAGWWLIDGLD